MFEDIGAIVRFLEKSDSDLTRNELYLKVVTIAAQHDQPRDISLRTFNRLLTKLGITTNDSGYYCPADAVCIVGWVYSRERWRSVGEYAEKLGSKIYQYWNVA